MFMDVSKWELDAEREREVGRMNLQVMQKDEVMAMMLPRDNKVEE